MRHVLLALALLPTVAAADPRKLTLDEAIARAIASPRVQMAHEDRDAAEARVAEADAARLPRIRATAFGTLSPDVNCLDPNCITTDPQNFAFRFDGMFAGGQIDITQPLYTFGKIGHARTAARAGVRAQQALVDEAAGDAAVDAARAYWGVKLARELGAMLDDGIEEIEKARATLADSQDITIQDKQRLAVLHAEAKVQRAEAMQAEAHALAGLRAITALATADVDDELLAPARGTVDAVADASARPQQIAARQGAAASAALADLAAAYYFPDLALVATGVYARAKGVPDAPGIFANDPFNRSGAGLVLALQWQLEPWTVKARTDRARAEARKMQAQADLAAIGATFDAQLAVTEVRAARARVDAAGEGEQAARAWLASVLQGQAVGVTEPKDLADAYVAWFQIKARWAQAVMQWNVALVRVRRAGGVYRAP